MFMRLSAIKTDDGKQFQYVHIVLKDKTVPLLNIEFN